MATQKEEIAVLISQGAVQGEKINGIEKTCSEIKTCLLGNGKPGLVVRTDRLEQRDKFQSKIFWLMFTTVSAVTIKVLADAMGLNIP
jgi:hypothetical protein